MHNMQKNGHHAKSVEQRCPQDRYKDQKQEEIHKAKTSQTQARTIVTNKTTEEKGILSLR